MNVVEFLQKVRSHKLVRIRSLVILAVLSLMLLIGVIAWRFNAIAIFDATLNRAIYRVSPKSIAVLSLDQTSSSESAKLKLTFKILSEEQTEFDSLASKLGLGQKWPEEITVGVTEDSKVWLSSLVPLELNLTLSDTVLEFGNTRIQSLLSSQMRSYDFASGSGQISVSVSGSRDLEIEVVDLKTLIREASRAGELYVSPMLGPVGGVIDKVEAVDLKIVGKQVKGKVVFEK